ncbi:uncharacterized protein [Dendropsophus ebraccatus]|uniref:uncharacterized protein n=1 Tax=Dendropsophus ebraccatus TaxID=150705 RepID=UPI0038315452
MELLRQNQLFAKLSKCQFGVQEVSFLGYKITPSSFGMDPLKVAAIEKWERPRNLKALQRFLGFANYYRKFIKGFSVIAKPLTDLTRRGADMENWTPEAMLAFDKLKTCFSTAPVLIQPDFELPFIVEVDASENKTDNCIQAHDYQFFKDLEDI